MAVMSMKAKVRRDGALEIPAAAREELGLNPGDVVEVEVHSAETEVIDPLLEIIGLGDGRPDGSVNHDSYLYGQQAQ